MTTQNNKDRGVKLDWIYKKKIKEPIPQRRHLWKKRTAGKLVPTRKAEAEIYTGANART